MTRRCKALYSVIASLIFVLTISCDPVPLPCVDCEGVNEECDRGTCLCKDGAFVYNEYGCVSDVYRSESICGMSERNDILVDSNLFNLLYVRHFPGVPDNDFVLNEMIIFPMRRDSIRGDSFYYSTQGQPYRHEDGSISPRLLFLTGVFEDRAFVAHANLVKQAMADSFPSESCQVRYELR